MVAEQVETTFNLMHLVPVVMKVQRVTAGDWVVLEGFKGVIPLQGIGQSIAASLADTFTWGTATVTNTETATATTIEVTLGTITRTPPYYVITAGGEIMEVLSETAANNATSVWTVRRGCLGTTATTVGVAATNLVGIMNIVFCGANNVGPDLIIALPLPQDAGTRIFA